MQSCIKILISQVFCSSLRTHAVTYPKQLLTVPTGGKGGKVGRARASSLFDLSRSLHYCCLQCGVSELT